MHVEVEMFGTKTFLLKCFRLKNTSRTGIHALCESPQIFTEFSYSLNIPSVRQKNVSVWLIAVSVYIYSIDLSIMILKIVC